MANHINTKRGAREASAVPKPGNVLKPGGGGPGFGQDVPSHFPRAAAFRGQGVEERALVTAAAGGDHDAFAGLLARHQSAAFRYASRLVGNQQDAEDVIQDAHAAAWRSLARGANVRESFRQWYFGIVRNTACALLRTRRGDVSLSDQEGSVTDIPNEDARLERVGQRTALSSAFRELSGRDRTFLFLSYFEDLTYREIGVRMACSEGAARTATWTALEKLRASASRTPNP